MNTDEFINKYRQVEAQYSEINDAIRFNQQIDSSQKLNSLLKSVSPHRPDSLYSPISNNNSSLRLSPGYSPNVVDNRLSPSQKYGTLDRLSPHRSPSHHQRVSLSPSYHQTSPYLHRSPSHHQRASPYRSPSNHPTHHNSPIQNSSHLNSTRHESRVLFSSSRQSNTSFNPTSTNGGTRISTKDNSPSRNGDSKYRPEIYVDQPSDLSLSQIEQSADDE